MDQRLRAYAVKVAGRLRAAGCPTVVVTTRPEAVRKRSWLGFLAGPRATVNASGVVGWFVRDEVCWYEERNYPKKSSTIRYREEEERDQVVLTVDGELLERYVTRKVLVPGPGPYESVGEFQPISESRIESFNRSRARRSFRRRDDEYLAEGWSVLNGRIKYAEPGKGLSMALTELRRQKLGR